MRSEISDGGLLGYFDQIIGEIWWNGVSRNRIFSGGMQTAGGQTGKLLCD